MSRYQAYPDYKKSGIKWLGKVPDHWEFARLKFSTELLNGYSFNSDDYVDDGIPVIRIGDVREVINWNLVKRVPQQLDKSLKRFLIEHGDILLAMTGATIGKTSVWTSANKALLNQRVGVIRSSSLDQNYLSYCAHSESFTKHIEVTCYGGAQENIGKEDIGDIWLAFPLRKEQTQIAAFLDRETAKIDQLINKQQRLIKLLEEKHQAVISHAVTKGLNPDTPMKDSGSEWLGDVPKHWKVKRFKFLCKELISGPFGSSITKNMYVKNGYKVYGQEQVIPDDFSIGDYYISEAAFQNLKKYAIKPRDILISCVGTFGKIAAVPENAELGIINPRLIKATLNNNLEPIYLTEFLKSENTYKQFELLSRGGTMGVINLGILNEIIASLPPLSEQTAIIKFLSTQKVKFKNLIQLNQKAIILLKERRTALISAAVTGKIDVRNTI